MKDPSSGEPLYLRYCGPARAVVYLNGKTYRIRGGHCYPLRSPRTKTERRRLRHIAIGLITNEPAAPGRGIALGRWIPPVTRPGAVKIDDSEIEVPGMRVAASGTIIIGKALKGGRFSLYGRDAFSGPPNGVTLTGSWTCG